MAHRTNELLGTLRARLEIELEANSPVLYLSGGKDSMLLWHVIREIKDIPVIIFEAFWDKHQKKWIKEIIERYKPLVFFYRPNLLEYKNGSTIIAHYPFGQTTIPVIQDVIHSESCGIAQGNKALGRTPLATYLWDMTFTGSRKHDTHGLIPKLELETLSTPDHRISTPLWEWHAADVWDAIELLDVPTDDRVYKQGDETADTGNANLCMNCLAPEGQTVYCPKLSRNISSIGA